MKNRVSLAFCLIAVLAGCQRAQPQQQAATPPVAQQAPPSRPASGEDPRVAKNRVIVITDIANEPDDQMSMVRFLVYSNEFDVEG